MLPINELRISEVGLKVAIDEGGSRAAGPGWKSRLVHEEPELGSVSQEYHIRFRIPDSEALAAIDERFVASLVVDEMNHDRLKMFEDGSPLERSPYANLTLPVDPKSIPLAERLHVEVAIDPDAIASVTVFSSMRGESRRTQNHDLEFGLSIHGVGDEVANEEANAAGVSSPAEAAVSETARVAGASSSGRLARHKGSRRGGARYG